MPKKGRKRPADVVNAIRRMADAERADVLADVRKEAAQMLGQRGGRARASRALSIECVEKFVAHRSPPVRVKS